MDSLVSCDSCHHGATVHEAVGCTYAGCRCRKNLANLINDALDAARTEIRREWHPSEPAQA